MFVVDPRGCDRYLVTPPLTRSVFVCVDYSACPWNMAGKRGNLRFAAFAWRLMPSWHIASRACAEYACVVCVVRCACFAWWYCEAHLIGSCPCTLVGVRVLLKPPTAEVCWCIFWVRNWKGWEMTSSLSFLHTLNGCAYLRHSAYVRFFFSFLSQQHVCKCGSDTEGLPVESMRNFWSYCLWPRDLEGQCTIRP